MQIKPLFINLKDTSGKLNQHQRLDFKVREHIERYGRLPKWNKQGYYRRIMTPDAELQSNIDSIQATTDSRLARLLKDAPRIASELDKGIPPHYTHPAYDFNKHRCALLSSITALLRAKALRNWDGMEDAFYHINTEWLAIHHVIYGKGVSYKNSDKIAHEQGKFIPLQQRRFGRRK